MLNNLDGLQSRIKRNSGLGCHHIVKVCIY